MTSASVSFAVAVTELGGVVDPFAAFEHESLARALAVALPGGEPMLGGLEPLEQAGGSRVILVRAVITDGMAAMQELRSVVLSGDFGLALTKALNAEERIDQPRLEEGAPVRLAGLKQRPALNGSQAVLLDFQENGVQSRWRVRAGAEMLAIRAVSLRAASVTAMADASEFAEQHEAAALSMQSLTPHQAEKLEECGQHENVHLMAPAGAGKTYVALHQLLWLLRSAELGFLRSLFTDGFVRLDPFERVYTTLLWRWHDGDWALPLATHRDYTWKAKYVQWEGSCYGRPAIDTHPCVLAIGDLPRLISGSRVGCGKGAPGTPVCAADALFANKMVSSVDSLLTECLRASNAHASLQAN